jgi:cold shock CspA family protein
MVAQVTTFIENRGFGFLTDSSGEQYFFHVTNFLREGAEVYFDQTDASIEMGNLQGKEKDGKESWSARVNNKYVVAAGSIHPLTGEPYIVQVDAPLVPAPLWLVDWLKDNAFNSSKNPEGARVNASPDGPAIPRGSHDNELFRSACLLRNAGMGYEQIRDNLIMICEQRCVDHGSDYVDMCEKKAVQACKYEVGKANPKVVLGSSVAVEEAADVSNWRSLFSNISEMEQGDNEMIIAGVLQEAGTCFLGASAGHGKTLLALSLSKAITLGKPLFGMPEFAVKTPRNVVYLMTESSDRAFRKRCELFGLPIRMIALSHAP